MICDICSSVFSSTRALNHHKKTAKYCLNKKENSENNDNKYVCALCNKIMSTKHRLNTHKQTCSLYKENAIEQKYEKQLNDLHYQLAQKDKQIQILQDKLENIAIKAVQKSTTTIKNTHINYIQKMEPITLEHLVNHVPQLTIEHIKKGASGYAEYALEGPLKDRIACVDYSRRKIKFKDIEGNVITDPEMTKLAPMFFDSIKDKSSQLVYNLNTSDMDSSMFEGVAKLFNTNADVKNGAIGIKTDFYHDFIKQVCSGSVVDN